MNRMLKLLAVLLALMLCCSMAAAEEEEALTLPDCSTESFFTDDSGDWSLVLLWYNNGNMFVSVEHRTAEGEADIWSFDIEGAYEGDSFDYISAFKGHATMDAEDGTLGAVEEEYNDGTGTIALDGDLILWTDNTEGQVCEFGLISSSTTTFYHETEHGVAEMSGTSTEEDNSVVTCLIEQKVSDTEKLVWNLTLLWDDDQNLYVYSDAVCTRMTTTEGDYAEETLYTEGKGTFTLMGDGSLVWADNADGTGTGYRFEINMLEL